VSADAAAPKRAAKLPRGVCFVCGLEYALRSNGLVRKHSAGVLCQSGEHNHAACISRYGLLATPYTSPHELPDCQGSGWLPNPQGGVWLVGLRGVPDGDKTHLGFPDRLPETDYEGIYLSGGRDAFWAMQFPVQAADEWAHGLVGWRLVCNWGALTSYPDAVVAFLCIQDPPAYEQMNVQCSSCRRWANLTRRNRPRGWMPGRHRS
jgi:hypothetical protein